MTQQAVNYGKALFELQIPEAEVECLYTTLIECTLLEKVLCQKTVSRKQKQKIMEAICKKEELSQELQNFTKLVIRQGYEEELKDSCLAYHNFQRNAKNILDAVLYYVTKPTSEQETGIRNYLCKKYHCCEVDLKLHYQPTLIGGFILKAGNEEIDCSMKGRRGNLWAQLVQTK